LGSFYEASMMMNGFGDGSATELSCASTNLGSVGQPHEQPAAESPWIRERVLTLFGRQHDSVCCGCLELQRRGMMMDVLAEP